jgi:hypothetical protein
VLVEVEAESAAAIFALRRRGFNPLLRQEKDEAGPANCFCRDSLNAFIPRLAESEGFFVSAAGRRQISFRLRAGLSISNPPAVSCAGN